MQLDKSEIKMIADLLVEELKPMFHFIQKSLKKEDTVLMKITDVANYLNVSKQYIYKLTHENKIPHKKPTEKLLLFRKKEIDDWLDSHQVPIVAPLLSKRLAKQSGKVDV